MCSHFIRHMSAFQYHTYQVPSQSSPFKNFDPFLKEPLMSYHTQNSSSCIKQQLRSNLLLMAVKKIHHFGTLLLIVGVMQRSTQSIFFGNRNNQHGIGTCVNFGQELFCTSFNFA